MPTSAKYTPDVFDVENENDAKRIILTPQSSSTDDRWKIETPYITDLITQNCDLNEHSLVIDYGCGIGRLTKPLIDAFGCYVVGIDISKGMRKLAMDYVDDERFLPMSRKVFTKLAATMSADLVIASWVLQHCPAIEEDLRLIKSSLDVQGKLFVVNNLSGMAIPTDKGWVHDGFDLWGALDRDYESITELGFPEDWPDLSIRNRSKIALYASPTTDLT